MKRVVSFVEGARTDKGGLGISGVPHINYSLASRGNSVALNVCGGLIPNAKALIERDQAFIGKARRSRGQLQILSHPALDCWGLSPALLRVAGKLVRDADLVMLHSLYSFPVFVGHLCARLHRKPYVVWPHGVLAPAQRRASRAKKTVYDFLIARSILAHAHVLVFSAAGEREETKGLGLAVPSVVIPHGIDTSEFRQLPARGRFRAQFCDGFDGPLVLYLGRLNAKKGLDLLVKAMALVADRHPDARLAIVGGADPPRFSEAVTRWIADARIEAMTVMCGMVDHPTKLAALADADVLVLPSEAENFGFAMFEAMACRVPVVVSATVNLADEVRKYGAGIAVNREPDEMACAISRLLADPQLRARMGSHGLDMASAYSWERCGESLELLINCILSQAVIPESLMLTQRLL